MRFLVRLVLAACFALVVASLASAQITSVTNDQATPIPGAGHDYIHMLDETVNPANGSASLRLHTPMPKGRGLSIPFAFAYDSNGVYHLESDGTGNGGSGWSSNTTFLSQGGWSYSAPLLSWGSLSMPWFNGGGSCSFTTEFVFQDPAGGRHALGLSTTSDNQGGDGSAACGLNPVYSAGDDFFRARSGSSTVVPFTWAAGADGTVFYFSTSKQHSVVASPTSVSLADYVEDRNGNKITFTDYMTSTGANQGVFTYTDTLGRTVLSSSGFGATGNTVSISGLSGPHTIGWGTATANHPVNSFFVTGGECTPPPSVSRSQPVITSISLPNSKTYQFFYDQTYGVLNKIVYPTGGYVRYVWGVNSLSDLAEYEAGCPPGFTCNPPGFCDYRYDTAAIYDRYVSFDGTTEVLHQHFNYSTTWSSTDPTHWTTKQTTVTTSDLLRGGSFQTIYTYTSTGCGGPDPPNVTSHIAAQCPVEQTVVYKDWNGSALRTVNKTWQDVNMMLSEQTTLENGRTSKTTYSYANNNTIPLVTEKDEYDFGLSTPGALIGKTVTSYAAFPATPIYTAGPSIFDRPSTVITYDGAGNRVAESDYAYDQTSVATVSNLPSGTHDETNYTATYNNRGNATTVTKKCLQTCANSVTTFTYDETGQVLSMTDPCGNATCSDMTGTNHTTQYSYVDNFDSPPSANTNAYLTQVTYSPTNSVNHIEKFKYAYSDGQLIQSIDQNNHLTNYLYNDSLRRLIEIDYPTPDGGVTTNTYTDTPGAVSVETKHKIDATRWTDSFVLYDGLGQPIVHSAANGEASPWDRTDTCYDGTGRSRFTSYPYQASSATAAPNCTSGVGDSFSYDALGRVTQVTHSDGNTALTSYTGRAAQAQDEGNGTRRVSRVSQMDGLGRLISVCEVSSITLPVGGAATPAACGQDIAATGFLTTYGYDALDNLASVTQPGLNPRSFTYDSLSRLLSASNPESGSITYTYDANGNVSTKTDARNITATHVYDALNRLTQKSYSDGTLTATFNYDQTSAYGVTLVNTIGRMSSDTTASPNPTGKIFSYDQLGRVKINSQCTPQNCASNTVFPITYTYDLLGDLLTSANGAGVTLTYAVNTAARLTTLTSSLSDSNHPGTPFSSAHYNAAGSLLSASLGNGISETLTYDPRLRLASITDGSLYSLTIPATGGYAPNSDILTANDSVNSNWTYTYDDFNRLLTSNATGQAYTYDYDRYGNRWHQNGPYSSQLGFDANNHITAVTGVGYDLAGNLTSDGSGPGTHTYFYDAESRIIQVDGTLGNCSTATACYVYNADGQRVRKTTGSTSVDYLYDLADNQITELTSTGSWNRGEVYAGTRHLATYGSSTTYFNHSDWLGTERVRSNMAGTAYERCTSLPFGDALACSGSDPSPMHFTGKERDSESGLDNFTARYFGSSLGRFQSPDPSSVTGDIVERESPQGWNMYSYVLNNPLNAVDPDGLDCVYINNDTGTYEGFNRGDCDNSTEEKANTGHYVEGTVSTIFTTTGDTQGVVTGYSGTGDAPGTLISGTISTPLDTTPNGSLPPSAVAIFADINQRNIMNNTLKMFGAGAVIGATGGAACYYLCPEAGITTLGLTGIAESATPGEVAELSQAATQGGKAAVKKALRSYAKRLAEHQANLAKYQSQGGYTSKTVSEIKHFETMIRLAEDWLSKNP